MMNPISTVGAQATHPHLNQPTFFTHLTIADSPEISCRKCASLGWLTVSVWSRPSWHSPLVIDLKFLSLLGCTRMNIYARDKNIATCRCCVCVAYAIIHANTHTINLGVYICIYIYIYVYIYIYMPMRLAHTKTFPGSAPADILRNLTIQH
jgi:hypothetical protein